MEAEHRDRAAQAPHGPHDVGPAAGRDARLDQCQVGIEIGGARVAAGFVVPRERQPAMDEGQLAAVGFGLLARADRVAHVDQRFAVAFDRGEQFRRDVAAHGVLREAHLQLLYRADRVFEHECARSLVRADQRVGRDVGVAVAIGADPAPERQEVRHRHAQLGLQPLEEQRRLVEDRFAKSRDQVAHFVADGRRGAVEFGALPQQHDLRAHLGVDCLGLFAR